MPSSAVERVDVHGIAAELLQDSDGVDFARRLHQRLRRVVDRDYRTLLATACWKHVTGAGGPGVALVLYDLTTLYFEAEKEDGLRKVGMSKERRVDPQITVGPASTAPPSGFPQMNCGRTDVGRIIRPGDYVSTSEFV